MDLPYEVLVYLFKYLPRADRKAASETCRAWYIAANDNYFLKSKLVTFHRGAFNDEDLSKLSTYENSSVIYRNYMFCDVEISSRLNGFWNKMGEFINSLEFVKVDVCEKEFLYILQKCPNLETLNIHSCKEIFMSGRLLEGKTEVVKNLDYLKSLSLTNNKYLTDALLNRFVVSAPLLEFLDLSDCSLQFHAGLIKRFYPIGSNVFENPSESVLTFYFIMQFFISRAKVLKQLILSNTLIDGVALKSIAEIEHLKLETLIVHSCDQLTNNGILALTTHQTSLVSLDLGLCSRVTDQSLVYICQNLKNLECLDIQRCRAVTDLGAIELRKLKKLNSLNIAQCDLITKVGFEKGICHEVNNELQDLNISALNLDQETLIMISEKLPKLKFLDISFCLNGVTDKSIQVILKNQIRLKTLKMSYCDKVTDAGLTGMGKMEEINDNVPIMAQYYECSSHHHKIHLGSRAEEEILRDAQKKREVMLMCEKLTLDSSTGYSLARLKCLQHLDISGCNRITDVSLTYTFNFKELIVLSLSRCQQISHEGMAHLVKNCPSIELFNLMDCYNLKDEAVVEIAKGLHRLENLVLKGCNQLTDKSVEALYAHCKKLQFLDVQGCRYITPEVAFTLGNLRTFHTLIISKPRCPLPEEPKTNPPPPAPSFFPSLLRKLRLVH
ncbi:F-box/LRR-repeat protein 14-like [Ostrinia nubilalis]|uniref:F-box/LRR-repeat protein 14-like n=1 Tax=Ostrinia nubilalis TaxID=29057 RepID=UPI003082691D